MKLLRWGRPGLEKPGIFHKNGIIYDLSGVIDDIGPQTLASGMLASLGTLEVERLPTVDSSVRLGPCVSGTSKVVCVGLNYADHARETGADLPREPVIFLKSATAICGPNDDIIIPPGAEKVDWEVELGVVIGKRASYVAEENADAYISGYCIVHDVSERAYQLERGGQWTKGKSADTFAPLGPWLITPDEIENLEALDLWLSVNDRTMQSGSTRQMHFKPKFLVSYISQFMTLLPGDVISTGTPAGVGLGQKPPLYLKPGDVVKLGINSLGVQQQRVISSAR